MALTCAFNQVPDPVLSTGVKHKESRLLSGIIKFFAPMHIPVSMSDLPDGYDSLKTLALVCESCIRNSIHCPCSLSKATFGFL